MRILSNYLFSVICLTGLFVGGIGISKNFFKNKSNSKRFLSSTAQYILKDSYTNYQEECGSWEKGKDLSESLDYVTCKEWTKEYWYKNEEKENPSSVVRVDEEDVREGLERSGHESKNYLPPSSDSKESQKWDMKSNHTCITKFDSKNKKKLIIVCFLKK